MTEALLGEPPSSARDEFTAKHFMAGGHNIIAGAGARVTIGDDPDTLIPVPTEHAPADFVDRPELTTPLLLHLLDDKPTLKGRASVSIVNGMGGIGKTTVVQWMVWQSELERRFPDGRIWVTLGNEPKDGRSIVNACLSKLHRRMPAETPTKDASGDLAAILQTRSVLFVIDDVWPGQSAEVARALIVPSPGSRFLLTSRFRFSELTDEPTLQAKEFPLDEMNIDQGTALIANTLGRQLRGTEKALAKGLCEAVGGHPLALELAAARIKRGRPWGPLIEDLTAEIVRLEVLNKPQSITAGEQPESDLAKRKQHSVIASLTLSVRGLPLFAKQLFAWLGIVFEDAAITPKMCATLWMADEEAARQYLDDLASVSLLRTTKDVYGIHDLMHDMARHLLTAPPVPSQDGEIAGLGLNLRDAHRQFLENYRGKTTNRPWHTLSDDGYIHDHLVRHFEKADLESDLSRLLWEENVDGQCGWYDARERLGQTAGFLADVERVWSYADRIFAGSEDMGARVQAATLQLHCALIIASVNSLSAAIPVALLLGGIRGGVFTLTDALALARRHPEREPRVQALCAVADEISPVEKPIVRAEALAAARGIDDAEGRSRALVEVALRLPVEDQPDMLREALNAAQEIHDASRRSTALARLLELLPPGEALGIVHNIGDQWEEKRENGASTWCSMPMWRPRALAVVARRLTADERLRVVEEALSAARGMDEARWQVAALGAVAQRLAPQEQ